VAHPGFVAADESKVPELNFPSDVADVQILELLRRPVFKGVFRIHREQSLRHENTEGLAQEFFTPTHVEVMQHIIQEDDINRTRPDIDNRTVTSDDRSEIGQPQLSRLPGQPVQRIAISVDGINLSCATDETGGRDAVVPDAAAKIHQRDTRSDADAPQEFDAVAAFPLFHWIVHNRWQAFGPKMALPNLTMFAPSSIATLYEFVIPMERYRI